MFEKWVGAYDHYPLHQFVFHRDYSVIHRLPLQASNSILDVGCGTGEAARYLTNHSFQGRLVGVDPSPEMIRLAQAKMKEVKNVEFLQAEAESLPFENDSFDVVVSTFSMHHWWNPPAAIREIRRVLKPGGKFVLVDLQSGTALGRIAVYFERLLGSGYGYFNREQLDRFLKDGEFERIHYRKANPLFVSMIMS